MRPPPRFTLFPYTTLFRSVHWARGGPGSHAAAGSNVVVCAPAARRGAAPALARSEEHTSELQSHVNLVCRLLLEKKKNNTAVNMTEPNHKYLSDSVLLLAD